MNERSVCRSCTAPVKWVKTAAGKIIPLDPEPTEAGNIIIKMGPAPGQETAHVESVEEKVARLDCPIPAGRLAFVSHFATCPQAKTWRGKPNKG